MLSPFSGGLHHQLERVAACFDGAVDGIAGRLSQLCLSLRAAFHDAVRRNALCLLPLHCCLGAGNITQWAYALPGELKGIGVTLRA